MCKQHIIGYFRYVILAIGLVFVASSCYSVTDDSKAEESFEDNLTNTFDWYGDKSLFVINEQEGLHLYDPKYSSKQAYLCFDNNKSENIRWEFSVKMNFKPSSQNYACFYLVSDNKNLTQPLNGYYIKIGGKQNNISLFRQQSKHILLLIDSEFTSKESIVWHLTIRVERNDKGYWRLYTKNYADDEFELIDEIYDDELVDSVCSGVVCRYTKTRSQHFWFHHIKIDDVKFDGVVNGNVFDKSDREGDKKDDNEDSAESTGYVDYKISGEILLNEVMFDPEEGGEEYIEIYNNTQKVIDIRSLYLHKIKSASIVSSIQVVGNSSNIKKYLLQPNDYACISRSVYRLVDKHMADESKIIKQPKLFKMNNSESGAIAISYNKDISDGNLLDICRFSNSMHTIVGRKTKGVSLEKDMPNLNSEVDRNWCSSKDKTGGTPCKPNK